jgi:hypothetical protein
MKHLILSFPILLSSLLLSLPAQAFSLSLSGSGGAHAADAVTRRLEADCNATLGSTAVFRVQKVMSGTRPGKVDAIPYTSVQGTCIVTSAEPAELARLLIQAGDTRGAHAVEIIEGLRSPELTILPEVREFALAGLERGQTQQDDAIAQLILDFGPAFVPRLAAHFRIVRGWGIPSSGRVLVSELYHFGAAAFTPAAIDDLFARYLALDPQAGPEWWDNEQALNAVHSLTSIFLKLGDAVPPEVHREIARKLTLGWADEMSYDSGQGPTTLRRIVYGDAAK